MSASVRTDAAGRDRRHGRWHWHLQCCGVPRDPNISLAAANRRFVRTLCYRASGYPLPEVSGRDVAASGLFWLALMAKKARANISSISDTIITNPF